jgi:hypothetical protein
VAASAADGGNDGALGAASDVRLVSGFANAFDDVVDFLLGGFLGHVDDHGLVLLFRSFVVFGFSRFNCSAKTKAAICGSRLTAEAGLFRWPSVAHPHPKLRRSRRFWKPEVSGKREA